MPTGNDQPAYLNHGTHAVPTLHIQLCLPRWQYHYSNITLGLVQAPLKLTCLANVGVACNRCHELGQDGSKVELGMCMP